jgi:hypothetical protein
MDARLHVVLTQSFDHKPLATVRNLPGGDADLTPAQMRALSAALCAAADDCEMQPMDRRQFKQKNRMYDLMIDK